MIMEEFAEKTIANMEVALERACQRLPQKFSNHEARKHIAAQIVECAQRGERSLKALTQAALNASSSLQKVPEQQF